MQLEFALQKLHNESNAEEILFWGKVTGRWKKGVNLIWIGIKNDYYIAVGLVYTGQFEFAQKKFFYCLSNDFNFSEFPGLNSSQKEMVDRDRSFFLGEPNRKLKKAGAGEENADEPPPEEEKVEEEDGEKKADAGSDVSEPEEIKVPTKDLTEVDRLRFVVSAIENDCQICPVGSFKMTAQHELRRNEAFQGLSESESLNLNSYAHFRNVQADQNKRKLDEPSAPFNKQFLESISRDRPSGCWNLQHDLQKETVLVRSLLWPGYHFYHCIG